MNDTAGQDEGPSEQEQEQEQQEQQEQQERLRQRRTAANRKARHALARASMRATIRERLEELREAGPEVYDLDEQVDMYGDRIVAALEDRVAALLGTEAAAFFPTGTMAQQVALRCWAARTGNTAVALHPLSHPEVHERHALSQVAGLRPVHVTSAARLPTAEEIRALAEPFGTLMLELPLRDAGFVLPSWEELTEVVAAARERDAVVHFDGARLWESTVRLGRSLDEIASLADSVYVSFYKSLGGLSGAALAGSRSLVEDARVWRHRYGGALFQQFPAALSALVGLERELPRLPEYVRHARVVAGALREGFAAAGLPWASVHPEEPHTHQFQVWLPYEPDVVAEAAVRQAEETSVALFMSLWQSGGPGLAVTEVTVGASGLEWTAQDVRTAVAEFAARLPERASRDS
ncbi:threonine aldolase family protein [Streptomyces sp. NPDC006012]|uniref:threonine aldolase family protein n=1 Tax=Streptomyces sp. NPDC006012 TaxID=3364739 RepID=UPI0036A858BF